MLRYFTHVRDGDDYTVDKDGQRFADLDDTRAAAITSARDMIADEVRRGMG